MQPLDDDMDELFRQAGEEYPLNTQGANWDKVLQGLQDPKNKFEGGKASKKDYRYLWLLLLLPIGFICGRYLPIFGFASNEEFVNMGSGGTHNNPKVSALGAKLKGNDGFENGLKKGVEQRNSVDIQVDSSNKLMSQHLLPDERVKKLTTSSIKKSVAPVGIYKNSLRGRQVKDLSENVSVIKEQSTKVTEKAVASLPVLSFEAKPGSGLTAPFTDTSASIKAPVTIASAAPPGQTTKIDIRGMKKPKDQFFYSLVLGPDESRIKGQKTSNLGYSIGVMIGYKITNGLAFTTGVLLDRKNYYTEGKYLDTTPLKLPMHSTVLNAVGYCDMIEIPINIKYDFKLKNNHSWFVSAGLSSYLMQKENYDIEYTRYNQTYTKDYGYGSTTKNWFSVMNISAGYQKKIGKFTDISIAPYLKLPLQRLGLTKLPISSTGIYFSVTRSIH